MRGWWKWDDIVPPLQWKPFEPTLSLHEIMQKGAPVPWLWLKRVHAAEVVIGHHIVLYVTSHVDYLQKEKNTQRQTVSPAIIIHVIQVLKQLKCNVTEKDGWQMTESSQNLQILTIWVGRQTEAEIDSLRIRLNNPLVLQEVTFCRLKHCVCTAFTLQFCSQKDLGMNWTGRWVLMRRGLVGSLFAKSTPLWREALFTDRLHAIDGLCANTLTVLIMLFQRVNI